MAASLIRLHFHDCFVQGCDASILLDETPSFQSEKTAFPNVNSVRGYDVIEAAKRDVERVCPGVVSCSDILTLAARDASAYVGGPSWTVRLGRRDSTTASWAQANMQLPSPFAGLDALISSFDRKGLNERDMVALSGSHTLGQAQCFLFRARINSNRTDIDAGFASTRRRRCPQTGGDANLAPLDLVTPNSFDNNYFRNLIQRKGLLQSDQDLFSGGSTDSIVSEYSRNPRLFASDFASAMIKMAFCPPPNLAFLFLTNSPLHFAPFSDRFFVAASSRHHYNIYIHVDPLVKIPQPDNVFRGRIIPSRRTQRSSSKLTSVLDNPANTYFALPLPSIISTISFSIWEKIAINFST
ncbi:lignin-forming anionic peroxidase [Phtheirospermum japonicum]|uniref:Peroxidase n=1 Tax=Phtheirospermum japonicum TaxID=374723 RepID=A0A830BNG5_9LAMI|nr:lignin-forming anionic peroxidase [Phtheirospermum japonicum]